MIGIHAVHRRMAEITIEARKVGGFDCLPHTTQVELFQCLTVNANMIVKLDSLKILTFHAYDMGDHDWAQDICLEIEKLEAGMSI